MGQSEGAGDFSLGRWSDLGDEGRRPDCRKVRTAWVQRGLCAVLLSLCDEDA